MAESKFELKWLKLSQIATERRVADVFQFLAPRFPVVLIKGWSASRFYDAGHYRSSTDIDILLSPGDRAPAAETLADLNLPISIDCHFGPRHLDTLTFEQLFDRSYTVELNGVPVRVLSDEDNLRIIAVHWMTDGGINKERLWDIFYLVKNREKVFDWERCLESNGPIRKTWVMAAIATARYHLDLDVSGLPQEAKDFKLPRWYEQTLEKEWRLGVYPRRILSTVIFRPKLLLEQLRRKFPPNRIAATIDTETPINNRSRIPSQIKSLTKKAKPFAHGLGRRITYSIRGKRQ